MDYHKYYHDQLYPLQDKFLHLFNQYNESQFYLTGGTALSRFYFQHRYSDDLDFFSVKEIKDFRPMVNKLLDVYKKQGFTLEVETISDHFLRFFLKEKESSLKIDLVNDAAFHWGQFKLFPLFPYVDNEHNILANKLTCVSRHEVKDIADIWVMAKRLSFSWREIMDIADKKSPTDPLEVSKIIKTLPQDELKFVKWASRIDFGKVHDDLKIIAEDILLGRANSLKASTKQP